MVLHGINWGSLKHPSAQAAPHTHHVRLRGGGVQAPIYVKVQFPWAVPLEKHWSQASHLPGDQDHGWHSMEDTLSWEVASLCSPARWDHESRLPSHLSRCQKELGIPLVFRAPSHSHTHPRSGIAPGSLYCHRRLPIYLPYTAPELFPGIVQTAACDLSEKQIMAHHSLAEPCPGSPKTCPNSSVSSLTQVQSRPRGLLIFLYC